MLRLLGHRCRLRSSGFKIHRRYLSAISQNRPGCRRLKLSSSSMNRFSIWSQLRPFTLAFLVSTAPLTAWTQSVTELPPQEVSGRPAGEELVGPYAQPRWSARGRFSADTDVYVLPPYSFYVDLDYHGTFPRNGKPDHLFTQEFELGLPYRFKIAFEMDEERQDARGQVPFTTIEGRWAPANWGKLPLNPTLFAEYDFGIGRQHPVQPG